MIDYSDIETTIETCFSKLQKASSETLDSQDADKTAALFLVAQFKVSSLIEEVEMKARNSKNEISRIEGEKYFFYKTSNVEKKLTENTLSSYIAKEPDIVQAKTDCAQHESNLKKWNYILGVLKDGHIYFRNLGKTKSWNEG